MTRGCNEKPDDILSRLARIANAREAYIDGFRERGTFEPGVLAHLESDLRSLIDQADGEAPARARLELATVLRLIPT